jgi:outer membrane receptor protein involved in Fe transport
MNRSAAGPPTALWRQPTVPGGSLDFGISVSSKSSFYQNARNFAGERFAGYTLVDLNSSWEGRSGYGLSAYIKNLSDNQYKTVGLDFSTVCGCNLEAYGMPRTSAALADQKFAPIRV